VKKGQGKNYKTGGRSR